MYWQLYVVIGLVSLILEMLAPSLFFLNFAVAGFLTAVTALFIVDWVQLVLIFVLFSILSILFLRPILVKNRKTKDNATGMEGKYVGKIAKVKEPIGKFSGSVTIYDERWEARCETDETIPEGTEVKITGYDSLVLKVERL